MVRLDAFSIIIYAVVIASTGSLSISSIVIGSIHFNSNCTIYDTSTIDQFSLANYLSLPIWLIVYGSVTLILTILTIIFAIFFSVKNEVYYIVTLVINIFFMFVWMIGGTFIFAHSNQSCETADFPLWQMTLAVLIINWCVFGCAIIGICCFYCLKFSKKN